MKVGLKCLIAFVAGASFPVVLVGICVLLKHIHNYLIVTLGNDVGTLIVGSFIFGAMAAFGTLMHFIGRPE